MNRVFSGRNMAAGTLLALAGAGMAACDAEEPRQDGQFYCGVVRDGVEEVVDIDDIDDDRGEAYVGGVYYPVMIFSQPYSGGAAYAPGQRLPANPQRSRIGYKDAAGRQKFGLPASGKIANGTVKTGVLGKGGGAAPAGKAGAGG